jgi:hypothetical protein
MGRVGDLLDRIKLFGGAEMELRKGTIVGFRGNWGSGLGFLLIRDDETECVEDVPCENAATVRALDACFGGIVGEGHTVDANRFEENDMQIYWSYDELGLILDGFTPVGESERLDELYAEQLAEV